MRLGLSSSKTPFILQWGNTNAFLILNVVTLISLSPFSFYLQRYANFGQGVAMDQNPRIWHLGRILKNFELNHSSDTWEVNTGNLQLMLYVQSTQAAKLILSLHIDTNMEQIVKLIRCFVYMSPSLHTLNKLMTWVAIHVLEKLIQRPIPEYSRHNNVMSHFLKKSWPGSSLLPLSPSPIRWKGYAW